MHHSLGQPLSIRKLHDKCIWWTGHAPCWGDPTVPLVFQGDRQEHPQEVRNIYPWYKIPLTFLCYVSTKIPISHSALRRVAKICSSSPRVEWSKGAPLSHPQKSHWFNNRQMSCTLQPKLVESKKETHTCTHADACTRTHTHTNICSAILKVTDFAKAILVILSIDRTILDILTVNYLQ